MAGRIAGEGTGTQIDLNWRWTSRGDLPLNGIGHGMGQEGLRDRRANRVIEGPKQVKRGVREPVREHGHARVTLLTVQKERSH